MDITKLDIKDLKSLAYDELEKIQIAQNNLNLINQKIVKRNEADELKDSPNDNNPKS